MILHAERSLVRELEPAIAAVEQRYVRLARIGRQGVAIDREAVVHAGDLDAAVGEALDRMVGAAVALVHLRGARTDREAEQLMAEADAEQRLSSLQHLLDDGYGIFAGRCGIA